MIRRTLSGSRSWEWAESSEAIYTSIRQQGFDLAFIHIQEPLKGVGREMAAMSNQHIHTDFYRGVAQLSNVLSEICQGIISNHPYELRFWPPKIAYMALFFW